ncbi:hypothetical protein GOP47_0016373 [Adiantum capillus-veneris]|uniref:Uncharacterized protein n=1 Tax=Adiantum capillus-veneris TaxID=13818 RepID=A0A9D4UIG5_ADICA|nr:hypothetical protein GOP47_0016373 [Adiantum capillus-veneris]
MEVQERTPPVQIVKRERATTPATKPPFRVVADDSKPLLRDPLLTSDPIETEQILLQPPPLKRTIMKRRFSTSGGYKRILCNLTMLFATEALQ